MSKSRRALWHTRAGAGAALALAALLSAPATAQDGRELVIARHTENQAMQAQQTYKEVNSPGLRNVISSAG